MGRTRRKRANENHLIKNQELKLSETARETVEKMDRKLEIVIDRKPNCMKNNRQCLDKRKKEKCILKS